MGIVTTADWGIQDFASIRAIFGGRTFEGFNSVKYSSELSSKLVYGSNRRPIRKTLGQLKCSCNVEFHLEEFERFKKDVLGGKGFMTKTFNLVVQWSIPGSDIFTDTIYGCSIIKLESGGQGGSDEILRSPELLPMGILWNGDDPLGEALQAAA